MRAARTAEVLLRPQRRKVSNTPVGLEEMDTQGTAPSPNLAPPPVLPAASTAPSAVVAEENGTRKGATSRSREPSLPGTPRTSGDEMDVGPYLPASQCKERPSATKSTEKPKKSPPRLQAPRNKT